ncbi:MAG: DUF3854 domain-containing protein [Prochloraceae cyanobacterium]|nr:DUF3854 domain-containing protein [Prochloraceae cyanobacterium]
MTTAKIAAKEKQSQARENTAAKEYPATRGKTLIELDYQHCCGTNRRERGLDPAWILANCYSGDIKEASQMLGYKVTSPGIIIIGKNGQFQFRPNKPHQFPDQKKTAKYLTALGDEYDALLPNHPTNPNFWNNIGELKLVCYEIDGIRCILVTEGGFKAISACSHGIPTMALTGVEMGLTPAKADPQGKRYLVPSLEHFAKFGFGFILGFDADLYTKKEVRSALTKLAGQLKKFNVPVHVLPEWEPDKGKGIDDYIQMNGIEEFRKQLMAQAMGYEKWVAKYSPEQITENKTVKPPSSGEIAQSIEEKYKNKWVYCGQLRSWFVYEKKTPGVWTKTSDDCIAHAVNNILVSRGLSHYRTNSYVNNIIGNIRRSLYFPEWFEVCSKDFLPFTNGVLELSTGQLQEHSPEFYLTWQLPRPYSAIHSSWNSINTWLDQATAGSTEHKQMLLCFAAAVLRGRADLQKFLHLLGVGGSGKSTYTNLITELIGEENTVTLNLSDLEDKHEIARIFGKRLVILPDQDSVGKKLSNFKRLTGQDYLSGRLLFENGFQFKFSGLVAITSNKPIFHSNLGTWLVRRLLAVPFNYKCPKHQQRNLIKDFEAELPAFTNYLLSIPIEEIDNTIKGIGKRNLSITAWETQIRADGLAAWLNDWVVEDNEGYIPIGSNKAEWLDSDSYDPERSTAYGSYGLYCRQTNRSLKTTQNFSAELLELVERILGWKVKKNKIKIAGKTVRVIQGLRLRTSFDESVGTIEEILDGDNPRDNQETPPGDNPEPLTNKELDNSDNQNDFSLELEENKKSPPPTPSDPPFRECPGAEIEEPLNEDLLQEPTSKNNLQINKTNINPSKDVSSCHLTENKGFGAVDRVGNSAVSSVVPPTEKEDYSTYPHPASKDPAACRNRASKCKEIMLTSSDSQELENSISAYNICEYEINWVYTSLLTPLEQAKFDEVCQTKQLDIFNQPEPSDNPNEITWDMAKAQIKGHMARLNWSRDRTREYVESLFGKKSLVDLTDAEIVKLLSRLSNKTE